MTTTFVTVICALVLSVGFLATPESTGSTPKSSQIESIYDFTVKDIDGVDVALSKYKGDVLLIVNVASK